MKRFKSLSLLIIYLFVISISINHGIAAPGKNKTFVFAVPPTGDVKKIKKQWQPLVEYIARTSHIALRFETAKNMKEFKKHLNNGAYDFVFMDAYLYTQYHDKSGYNAFAKLKDAKEKGVIVVHKDSDIRSLDDLNSKKLALSKPPSFDSTVLTRMELKKNGISVKPTYVKSANSVYKAVVKGKIPAGVGDINTLNNINPNAHAKLRVIWSSNQYSSNAFAAHSRVDNEVLSKLTKALIELDSSLDGKRMLALAKLKPIVAAVDSEWNDVRSLKLTSLKNLR